MASGRGPTAAPTLGLVNSGWWGIGIVVLLGALLVWYGWWSDRRATRDSIDAAERPAREIPGLGAGQARPSYLKEADVLATPIAPATAGEHDVIADLDEAPTLPGGVPDASFLNRPDEARAVVTAPAVLVLESRLDADADATTILIAAARRGRPLVIAAPGFAPEILGTLRANIRRGSLTVLPIVLQDPLARRRALALTAGLGVGAADLTSGWLPDESWGSCLGWVADLDDSWVLVEGHGTQVSGTHVT